MGNEDHATGQHRLTRRASIVRAGGLLAALGAGGWKSGLLEDASAAARGGPAGVASGALKCVLAPEQSEGPYFLDADKVRRNITEGKPGVPLELRLSVVDASTCRAIRGAAVDVWHCDASGSYSGVNGAASRYLRGIQRTNAKGLATFTTIYPGWYPGRTVHIHVRVFISGAVVHTGQLYFPEATSNAVYRRAPYNRRSGRDTRNVVDSIFRNGGSRSLLGMKAAGKGYVGSITMGVNR